MVGSTLTRLVQGLLDKPFPQNLFQHRYYLHLKQDTF